MRVDLSNFRYLGSGRFWLRVWREVNADDCWGMAAQLSYYFLLAFFPFLIFISALVSFIPGVPGLLEKLLYDFYRFVPEESYDLVQGILGRVLYARDQSVLTLGLASALWFASSAFNGMIALLNKAYEVQDPRSYFKTRTLAILVTIVVSVFLVLSGILIFFGDLMVETLTDRGGVRFLYTLLRWAVIFILLNVGVQIVYYSLPARRYPWSLITPGGMLATVGWIIGSLSFQAYVSRFGSFQILFGSLGALIILMLWFYLSSFCLLLGGEVDSEIHKIRREAFAPEPEA
jgi:membrane protein